VAAVVEVRRRVPQAPRHTEVDEQRPPGFEPHNQILAATVEPLHALPAQLGGDLDGIERPGQAAVGDLDVVHPLALEHGRELTANRLDLGKLGHARSLA